MEIVEIGIKLRRDCNYYDSLLRKNGFGFDNDFNVKKHDVYKILFDKIKVVKKSHCPIKKK